MHYSQNEIDEDGWVIARCTCGWEWGPFPGDEDATDALMDHAYATGYAVATQEANYAAATEESNNE